MRARKGDFRGYTSDLLCDVMGQRIRRRVDYNQTHRNVMAIAF
jgi:hypothetical protein